MTKKELLENDLLWSLCSSDLFNVWNDFCDENRWERVYDNTIDEIVSYYNNDLNEYLEENQHNVDYDVNDDYFTIDGYGHLKSFNHLWDEIDTDALVNWIDENDLYYTYWGEYEFEECDDYEGEEGEEEE